VPAGLISHVAAIDEDGELTIVDLWESEGALGRFVERRLSPAMAEVGVPEAQPRIHPGCTRSCTALRPRATC
jgi:hypothetical protein